VIKSKNLLGIAVAEDGLGDCSCVRTVRWPENVCSIYKGVNRDDKIENCYSPEGSHPSIYGVDVLISDILGSSRGWTPW